jgi:hypothetical protein
MLHCILLAPLIGQRDVWLEDFSPAAAVFCRMNTGQRTMDRESSGTSSWLSRDHHGGNTLS